MESFYFRDNVHSPRPRREIASKIQLNLVIFMGPLPPKNKKVIDFIKDDKFHDSYEELAFCC